MKLENLPNLYFVVSVLVPGFVYNGVFNNFVPLRQNKEKELIVLRFLTATAVNYAVCSPLIYLLLAGWILQGSQLGQAACWLLILFVAPLVLGLLHAGIVQHGGAAWFYKLVRLRPISPIPTGWDWIFSRTLPCYVLVTLIDGTEIAGFFGASSMASSDPERKDLFLERLYTVPDDGAAWVPATRSLGIHIDGSQIAFIEFRSTHD